MGDIPLFFPCHWAPVPPSEKEGKSKTLKESNLSAKELGKWASENWEVW